MMKPENRIEYLRYYDPLTKLPNREMLIHSFTEYINSTEQRETAIIVANIDRLHSINELYGRDVGDKVIIKLTKRLENAFDNDSAVFKEDHFYLCLKDVGADELKEIGPKVQEIINKPFKIDGQSFRVTVSIGISHYPTTAEDINSLLQQAEIAMSQVKKDGKNNYAIILPDDIQKIERKRILEFDLKEALNRKELYLAYQPEVSLETGEIQGAEALLRWEHPRLGNIGPDEFIPIAEETGVINEIGKWVIQEAVSEAKKWHEQGLKICISVNISYVQFKDKHLIEDMLAILKEIDFDTSYFIVEITESLMRDLHHLKNITENLNERKIRIAIDDFGTGYSSLSLLGNIYIDMIKIDRVFIKNIETDEKASQLVKTMIQIAESIGSTVIAEGVENEDQVDFLRKSGCEFAQGYYFSRPVSTAKIIEYAKNKGQLAIIEES